MKIFKLEDLFEGRFQKPKIFKEKQIMRFHGNLLKIFERFRDYSSYRGFLEAMWIIYKGTNVPILTIKEVPKLYNEELFYQGNT